MINLYMQDHLKPILGKEIVSLDGRINYKDKIHCN